MLGNGWGLVECRRLEPRHRPDERSWIETEKLPNPLVACILLNPCYAQILIIVFIKSIQIYST
jgi:hypothetical protein